MKIFTVGMNEKLSAKDNPVSPDGVTLASTPIITFEKKRTCKNYVMCLGMLFFILLFTIIISKLIYYRISDDLGLPWFEMKHRRVGCDIMSDNMIQSSYPQRSSRVFENSNNAAAALAVQAGQSQTSGQVASTSSPLPHFESGSSVDLSQAVDSRLDFLRKIIPKIKEQAEKSGIEGVMQVKVLQMDSLEPRQLFGGSNENQLRSGINTMLSRDFMVPFRPTLLSDLLRWNIVDNNENQISGNQLFGTQQDDTAKSGPMLVLGPFLQPQQLLPGAWDNDNNVVWSNSLQPHLFDLAQKINRQQQWSSLWQWLNKNSNDKVNQWQNMQWSNTNLITPVLQQNPLPVGENGNQWSDYHVGSNWQNSIQNGASNNQWPQNEWAGQGQQQQFWSQYPQTWQASINQNQYQNKNDWNIQRANIIDNLDGRMTQAVLPNDNVNSEIYNSNANDQWNRYYIQWHTNNQRIQQQPIVNSVVSQSLEMTGSVLPQQIQDQTLGQQQSQITDSLQSQTVLEQQIDSLSSQAQQQKEQPQPIQQFPNKPVQSQINAIPNETYHQNPISPVVSNQPDDNIHRTPAPFIFNSDKWKKVKNPNLLSRPINDNQEHLQFLHQQRQQLPIHPIRNMLSDNSGDTKIIDDELSKIPIMEQSGLMNDINRGLSNPILFQVDEPPPQSASMDENFAK